MSVFRALRVPVWTLAAVSLAAPAQGAPAAPQPPAAPAAKGAAARSPLEVKVGVGKDYSRIEFHWAGPVAVSSRREGQLLTLRFSRNARADVSRLRLDPPRHLKAATVTETPRGLEVRLRLDAGADARVGRADGATFVHLFEAPSATAESASAAAAERPDPAPANGVVTARVDQSGEQLLIRFPWRVAPASAVFRRGDALWIVFDGKARLELAALQQHLPLRSARVVQAEGATALRIVTDSSRPVNAYADGPVWTVALGSGVQAKPAAAAIGRDGDAEPPGLAAAMAGATRVFWIDDPAAGDRLAVVTAMPPSKGVPERRDFVELAVLPSANGLAIERPAEDLQVASDGDVVRIGRPGGLKLSPAYARLERESAALGLPQPASMPALIDSQAWAQTGGGGFLARHDQLMSLAAVEAGQDKDRTGPVQARLGLARFLIGSGLSFEAIGVLDGLGERRVEMMSNAEFRGLRGAAKVMAGRYSEALTDFASPALADDPSSALWRAYANSRLGHWSDARSEFQKGLRAFELTEPLWRARFIRADAEAALAMGAFASARTQIKAAIAIPQPVEERLAARLIQARVIEGAGHPGAALPIYEALSRAPLDAVAAPALLRSTQIRLDQGKLSPAQASQTFDGLRFRWRGDWVELAVIRALGQLHLNQGRYREALEALRSAGHRLPDLPEAMQLQADLGAAFRALFLEGQADGLQPVQALALFYDFKELTPVGAEGDEMVRRLAQRLVNVDLLEQAALLLKYQAENRLDGVPRAVVATDQALIEVMARRPEAALDALNASRTTLLPTALNLQRRQIEARAWLQLNKPEHALEILGDDASAEAQALRGEIAWRRRDWSTAGRAYEAGLGRRFDTTVAPLSADEEQRLLRAAVAYSLAEDPGALARLRSRYQPFVQHAHAPDALRVALAGSDDAEVTTASFASAVSDDQSFENWVVKMKQRLRDKAAPGAPPASLKTAQGPTSAAG